MKNNKINRDEFLIGFQGSSSGNNLHSVSRHSRKEKLTSRKITVKDKITNLEKIKIVPEGNYSKKEMQKISDVIINELIISLLNDRLKFNKKKVK